MISTSALVHLLGTHATVQGGAVTGNPDTGFVPAVMSLVRRDGFTGDESILEVALSNLDVCDRQVEDVVRDILQSIEDVGGGKEPISQPSGRFDPEELVTIQH